MPSRLRHISTTPLNDLWAGSSPFEHKVKVSLFHLAALIHELHDGMEYAMPLYDQLIADVEKNSNLSQSLMDALSANTKTMKDALAQIPASADTAALQQAMTLIEQNNAKMAAAVIANTPSQTSNPASVDVKNDGPTEAQNDGAKTGGLVPPTTGSDTAGVTGPGPDQGPAPATTPVDAPDSKVTPSAASATPGNAPAAPGAAGSGTGNNAATGAQEK